MANQSAGNSSGNRSLFAAKDAECEHLFGRQLWLESRIEILPFRFAESIGRHLHGVVHVNRCRPFSRCVHLLILAQPNYEVRNFVLRNSCLVLRHQAQLDTRSLFLVKISYQSALKTFCAQSEEECIGMSNRSARMADGWKRPYSAKMWNSTTFTVKVRDNGSQSRAVDYKARQHTAQVAPTSGIM